MRSHCGYSLFEVLIAFTIMTIVLAALIPGQARLMTRANDADTRLLAYDYALSHMASLGISRPIANGVVQSSYRDWIVVTSTQRSSDTQSNVTITVENARGDILAFLSQPKAYNEPPQ